MLSRLLGLISPFWVFVNVLFITCSRPNSVSKISLLYIQKMYLVYWRNFNYLENQHWIRLYLGQLNLSCTNSNFYNWELKVICDFTSWMLLDLMGLNGVFVITYIIIILMTNHVEGKRYCYRSWISLHSLIDFHYISLIKF